MIRRRFAATSFDAVLCVHGILADARVEDAVGFHAREIVRRERDITDGIEIRLRQLVRPAEEIGDVPAVARRKEHAHHEDERPGDEAPPRCRPDARGNPIVHADSRQETAHYSERLETGVA